MSVWLLAAAIFVGLTGLARAEGNPELSCFSGPERVDNFYQNWIFTNNCPFEVDVRFSTTTATGTRNSIHFAFACQKTLYQTTKSTTVAWGAPTYTARSGICIDGKAVLSKDPAPDKPLATTGPGGAAASPKPDFAALAGKQKQRTEASLEQSYLRNLEIDEEQAAAKARLEREAREKREMEERIKTAGKIAEDGASVLGGKPASGPATGFDVGQCDKVEYDHYGEDNKTQLLCWRYNYRPDNADQYATCDARGVPYNGVLVINCKLGN